jgi:putative hydrolase of HD superfamily
VLRQYAPEGCDCERASRMALVHDLVEIDAGDTYAYDAKGYEDKAEREQAAADRIFGMLPNDLGAELRGLWEEFEACETPTARYASACDRIQPLLLNYQSGGISWLQHGIRASQVLERNRVVFETLPALEPFIRALIGDAVKRGWLAEG